MNELELSALPPEPAAEGPARPELERRWDAAAAELAALVRQPGGQLRTGELLLQLRQLLAAGAASSTRLQELYAACGLAPARVRQLCWVAECLNKCEDGEEIRKSGLPFSLVRALLKTSDPVGWARKAVEGPMSPNGQHRHWYLTELQEAIAKEETERKHQRPLSCKRPGCQEVIRTQSDSAIMVRIGRKPRFYLCSAKCAGLYFTPPEPSPQDHLAAASASS